MNIPSLSAFLLPALTPLIGSCFVSSQGSFMHKTDNGSWWSSSPFISEGERKSVWCPWFLHGENLVLSLLPSFLPAFLSKRKSETSS